MMLAMANKPSSSFVASSALAQHIVRGYRGSRHRLARFRVAP
jgi:hypothetical protein